MQNPHGKSQPGDSGGGSDVSGSDAGLDELHSQVASAEAHILDLERDLDGVAAREAQLAEDLAVERARRSALDQQLGEAREEASRLAVKIAFAMRDAAAAEAEQTVTDARRESEALVNAGREQLRVAESEAAGRLADLETEQRALSEQLQVMEVLYAELQATLQLVAETSVNELAKAQDTLKQLDPAAAHGPSPESASGQTTTADPDAESIADREGQPDPASDQPAAIEVPPLSGGA